MILFEQLVAPEMKEKIEKKKLQYVRAWLIYLNVIHIGT